MISVLWYIAIGIALAGEWNEKPVMCEQKQVALDAVRAKGEIPMITGVQSAKVRAEQGLADAPVHIPLQIFVNLKTKTFSILEFHPSINSVCIIGYGDDFNLIGAKS
jgi:hypothetical protein|tara:strand:+ start:45 stop:365 length:321 start_codon:yes stop_codon:yes gene_type:complete